MLLALWVTAVLVTRLPAIMLHIAISDEVERNIPLERRPSLRFMWIKNVLKTHANLYPSSRLRLYYRVSWAVNAAVILGPFVAGIVGSCFRPK